jgi:hypothetical protein
MQLRYKPGQRSYIAFESAARSMLKAAEEHKDVLVPYGLSAAVTVNLTELLDRFAILEGRGVLGAGDRSGRAR